MRGTCAGDALQTGESGDAVCALGVRVVSPSVVAYVTSVAVFDGDCGQFGHGRCGGVGGAAMVDVRRACCVWRKGLTGALRE